MLSVIIPCYNEKENIEHIIKAVFRVLRENGFEGEVIVVDDESPDGTAAIAQGMMDRLKDLRVVVRKGEKGLSSAIVRGFREAKGDIIVVMDADLSHPPELLPELVRPLLDGRCEMTIASRYVKGGGTEGWPLKRRMISKGATLLARLITDVCDPMSGFFAIKRSVVDGVELNPKGYKIALEVLARGNYRKVIEVPFVFRDRKAGLSKLDNKVIREYVSHLSGLLLS